MDEDAFIELIMLFDALISSFVLSSLQESFLYGFLSSVSRFLYLLALLSETRQRRPEVKHAAGRLSVMLWKAFSPQDSRFLPTITVLLFQWIRPVKSPVLFADRWRGR